MALPCGCGAGREPQTPSPPFRCFPASKAVGAPKGRGVQVFRPPPPTRGPLSLHRTPEALLQARAPLACSVFANAPVLDISYKWA